MKILLAVIFLLINSTGFAAAGSSNYYVCNQPFALCTTAPCTPVPGTTDQSICRCIVQDGPSLGQVSCEKRKPSVNSQGQHLLTSNYAFVNHTTNKVMTCTGNHAWTDCLDRACVIDPVNSNEAKCNCKITRSESFLTFGGECNTDTCGSVLYSGATAEMVNQGSQQLIKALHLTKTPMENCPQ